MTLIPRDKRIARLRNAIDTVRRFAPTPDDGFSVELEAKIEAHIARMESGMTRYANPEYRAKPPKPHSKRALNAAAVELLAQCRLFKKSIEYYISVDRTNGDLEGAGMKCATLNTLNDVIARAEGRVP